MKDLETGFVRNEVRYPQDIVQQIYDYIIQQQASEWKNIRHDFSRLYVLFAKCILNCLRTYKETNTCRGVKNGQGVDVGSEPDFALNGDVNLFSPRVQKMSVEIPTNLFLVMNHTSKRNMGYAMHLKNFKEVR